MASKKTPETALAKAQEMIGKQSKKVTSEYPMEYEPLRRYCMMVDDKNPLFQSPEFAKTTKYGEVISPPFTPSGIMEKNLPFFEVMPPRPGPFLINLSQEWELMKPIKVGDRISSQATLADAYTKPIKLDPKAMCIVFETEVTNQNDETVCIYRNILLSHRSPSQVKEDEQGNGA